MFVSYDFVVFTYVCLVREIKRSLQS
jgi:hypothetical protein